MELRHFYKIPTLFLAFFAFFNMVGFTGLEKYVELETFVNARRTANFNSQTKNKAAVLSRGTKGEILKTVKLPTGNHGMQIKVLDGLHQGKVYWVYYNVKRPNFSLYKTLDKSETTVAATQPTRQLDQARQARANNDERAFRDEQSENQGSLRPRGRALPAPTVKSTAPDTQEIANLMNESLQQTQSLGSRTSRCVDCSIAEPELPSQCNSQNSYIEKDLINLEHNGSTLLKALVAPPVIKGVLSKSCVQTSQRLFPPNVRYTVCEGDKLKNFGAKPCSSDRLANVVTNGFNLAASCMKQALGGNDDEYQSRINNIFKMITIESGFHLNPVSPEGASGLGQFLPAAVDYINRNALPEIKQQLAKSDIPLCQAIATEILNKPMTPGHQNKCDKTSISEGNPIKNLIYTMAYFTVNRDLLEKEIFQKSEFSDRLKLSETEKSILLDKLARWTHNSGIGGMSRPLKVMLLSEYSQQNPATKVEDITRKLSQYMISHPHPHFAGKPIAVYVSQYFAKSEDKAKNLEKVVGDSCLQN